MELRGYMDIFPGYMDIFPPTDGVGLTVFLTGYFGFPLVLSLAAVIWRWRRSRPSGLMWGHLLLALVVGLVGALIGLALFVMLVPVALMAYDRPPIGLAVYGTVSALIAAGSFWFTRIVVGVNGEGAE